MLEVYSLGLHEKECPKRQIKLAKTKFLFQFTHNQPQNKGPMKSALQNVFISQIKMKTR